MRRESFLLGFVSGLDEYQMLLLLGALVYEHKEMTIFKKDFDSEQLRKLKGKIYRHEYLGREKKFLNLNKVSTLIYPIYSGGDFFEVLDLTNLLEGDLIRVYAQILDRVGQIRKAGGKREMLNVLENAEKVIKDALEGIWLV